MAEKRRRRRTSEEKAGYDELVKRFKMLHGKQRVHGTVIRTCDWQYCLNPQHYTTERTVREDGGQDQQR